MDIAQDLSQRFRIVRTLTPHIEWGVSVLAVHNKEIYSEI
jgi:hypothetical protein